MIFTPFRMQTTLLPPSELRCCHCLRSVCCFLFPRRGTARFRVGVPGCAADRLPLLLPLPPHRLPFSVSSPWSGPIPGRGARWVRPPAPLFAACGVERPECPNKTQHNRQRLFQYLTGTEQAFVPAGAGGVIRRRGAGWMARPRAGPPPAGDTGGFFRVAIPGRRPRSDCTGCPGGSAECPLFIYIGKLLHFKKNEYFVKKSCRNICRFRKSRYLCIRI